MQADTPTARLFNRKIASQFYSIQNVNKGMLNVVKSASRELARQFEQIEQSQDPDRLAFITAKHYFTQDDDPLRALIAEMAHAPRPLSLWLRDIANNTWYLLALHAQNHINTAWSQQVIPEYQANIVDRYPLKQAALNEISLADFQHFFKPQGTLENFFTSKLAPFVDTSADTWHAKQINGLKLSVSDQALKQFIHAQLIQKMFYFDGKHFAVPFRLTATNVQQGVDSVRLDIQGSVVTDKADKPTSNAFVWPTEHASVQASVAFTKTDGKVHTITEKGEWAWFRLMQTGVLHPNRETGHLDIVFANSHGAVKYDLEPQAVIHPFIPNVLNNLHLPTLLS